MSVGLFARGPVLGPHGGPAILATAKDLDRRWYWALVDLLPPEEPSILWDTEWPWEYGAMCGAMRLDSFRKMWEGSTLTRCAISPEGYKEVYAPPRGDMDCRYDPIPWHCIRQQILDFVASAQQQGATWISWG